MTATVTVGLPHFFDDTGREHISKSVSHRRPSLKSRTRLAVSFGGGELELSAGRRSDCSWCEEEGINFDDLIRRSRSNFTFTKSSLSAVFRLDYRVGGRSVVGNGGGGYCRAAAGSAAGMMGPAYIRVLLLLFVSARFKDKMRVGNFATEL